jgi:hypothetical protein
MLRFPAVLRRSAITAAALSAAAVLSVTTLTGSAASASQVSGGARACGATNYWVRLQDGFNLYLCSVTTKDLSGGTIYSKLYSHVNNRIWLHQNPDGSGWAQCFQGNGTTWGLSGVSTNPGNIQVSSNTAPCA